MRALPSGKTFLCLDYNLDLQKCIVISVYARNNKTISLNTQHSAASEEVRHNTASDVTVSQQSHPATHQPSETLLCDGFTILWK